MEPEDEQSTGLEPGMVLTAPPGFDTGHPTRVYVLLSDPAAMMVQLCPAGEDEGGDLIEAGRAIYVDRAALAEWEVVPGVLLPWPKPREYEDRPRRRVIMAENVTQEAARDLAQAHLEAMAAANPHVWARWHPIALENVHRGDALPFREPCVYNGPHFGRCWIAYLRDDMSGMMLRSSTIIAVDRETGAVLYFGDAGDEG
jgi:hypothetical protein